MNRFNFFKYLSLTALGAFMVLSSLLFTFSVAYADTEGPGNFCVQDYLPAAGCTANDVRIRAMYVKTLYDPCGDDNILVADFDIVFETAQPTRYDVGYFIATDANYALNGDSCVHSNLTPQTTAPTFITNYYPDYPNQIPELYDQLPSPAGFTGFYNIDGDACADMDGQTQAIRLEHLAIACVDRNNDGMYDISICNSWDNNAVTACTNLQQTYPGTSSKCGCAIVNLFGPTDVTLSSFSAKSSAFAGSFIPLIAAVLFVGSFGIIILVKKQLIRPFPRNEGE